MRVIAVATPRDKQERARFAHPNLNEGRLDIEPLSDDSCIDAGVPSSNSTMAMASDAPPRCAALVNFERQPFRPI
jgi:hypothetical protein